MAVSKSLKFGMEWQYLWIYPFLEVLFYDWVSLYTNKQIFFSMGASL